MADEYYQGKDLTVRFNVLKDGEEIHPASATVTVYDDKRLFITEDVAKIDGSEVNYILDGGKVQRVGVYIFVFDIDIRQAGSFTHIIEKKVKRLPISKGKK